MTRLPLFASLLAAVFCSVAGATPTLINTNTCSASTSPCYAEFDQGNTTGLDLAAKAAFSIVNAGTQLQIVLTNEGQLTTGNYVQGNMLSAIFFGTTSLQSILSPSSAEAATTYGGTPCSGGTDANDVRCNWGFNNGSTFAPVSGPNSLTNGLSTAGFGSGLFSDANFGLGTAALDGFNGGTVHGIPVAPSDISSSNCSGSSCLNSLPAAKGSITFLLNIATSAQSTFNLSYFDDVTFQYGTSLSDFEINELNPQSVPEPGFYGALSLGISGLFWALVRRKTKTQV
jgi:hypothetical protein